MKLQNIMKFKVNSCVSVVFIIVIESTTSNKIVFTLDAEKVQYMNK
jgi:hypothetical protein